MNSMCFIIRGVENQSHMTISSTVIPSLSLGLSLASPYLSPDRLDSFMRRMLVSRISRRVLAEHHIALSEDLQSRREGAKQPRPDHVGIIYTGLNVKDSIDRCAEYLRQRAFDIDHDIPALANTSAEWSEVTVDGHTDTTFPYIRGHLEYVCHVLLFSFEFTFSFLGM